MSHVSLPAATIERALDRAVGFLQAQQLRHGEFTTYAATNAALTKNRRRDSSVFCTALVLDALDFCSDPRVPRLLENGLDFIDAEMQGRGMWHYWSSRNPRHALLPPDLDDTCCCASLLKKYGRTPPDNRDLILANRNPQGLFYTWLAVRPGLDPHLARLIRRVSKRDVETVLSLAGTLNNVDCAVNANVVRYLGECAGTQAAIAYLIETVKQNLATERSTYYCHPFALYYFVSRAFRNGVTTLGQTRETIVRRIRNVQKAGGALGNPLLTALGTCTLLNFRARGDAAARAVRSLLRTQRPDGSWKRHALFLGPAPYYGSEELTTALCLQALSQSITM